MPFGTRGEDTWHMGSQVSCSCHAWEDSSGQVGMGDTWNGRDARCQNGRTGILHPYQMSSVE